MEEGGGGGEARLWIIFWQCILQPRWLRREVVSKTLQAPCVLFILTVHLFSKKNSQTFKCCVKHDQREKAEEGQVHGKQKMPKDNNKAF